jgi:8-oxo-dGTP diphosphatase
MERKQPKVVAACLVEKDGKFLLAKEKVESGKQMWLIPGGSVEFGETIEHAAVREVKEETNLDVEIVRLVDFRQSIHVQYDYHSVIFFFHAMPVSDELRLAEEILEARYFTKQEIKELDLVYSAKWFFSQYFN